MMGEDGGAPGGALPLDHLVIDVPDRLDAAAAAMRALGFTLTPLGQHTLGSSNHLVVLAKDYLELLSPGNGARPELSGMPPGLNGLVLRSTDADATRAAWVAEGFGVRAVGAFSRPVSLPEGERQAAFRTAHLDPAPAFGRLYCCQHLTPELVWRPEWQQHANGALAVCSLLLAAPEPAALTAELARLSGAATGADGTRLRLGDVAVRVLTPGEVRAHLGAAAPEPAGRVAWIAAVGLRTHSLAAAADATGLPVRNGQVLVPAGRALNVALAFAAQDREEERTFFF